MAEFLLDRIMTPAADGQVSRRVGQYKAQLARVKQLARTF
jgi:hypothetical protein